MKKTLIFAVALAAVVSAAPSFADTTTGAQGDSAIRQHSMSSSNVPETPIWRNSEFWHNEADRSGLPRFWETEPHGRHALADKMTTRVWHRHRTR